MDKKSNVIKHPKSDLIPVDVAISNNMRNMYITFGKDKVRSTLEELFGLKFVSKKVKKLKKVG